MTGACPTLDEERIIAFVAGELPIEGRRSVEEHVDDCDACRAVLAALVRSDASVDDATWKPGCRVGRYVIRERIGRGGMGTVFRAEDLELGRPVALKRLHAEDVRARTSLLREARAAALLQHPNVIAVYEVGDHEGSPFIAMELVDGTTLTAWLRAAPRTWREIVAVLAQAGRGLAAAHARGLVHRDFKPDNVLVDATGRARVADFGLARIIIESQTGVASSATQQLSRTTTTDLAGTPAYLAPELVHGEPSSASSDQYAFGVAAFEALHGRYPFAGETATEIWLEMAAGRVRDGHRKVPSWLDRRVRRALAVDPAARWPDMAAFASALERRPRRRSLIAIVGVVVLATAGYSIAHQSSELCTSGRAEVAGVWGMPTKARTRGAFLATQVPSADYVWQLVDRRLSKYGDDWALMHRDVCEATRRGEQSEPVMDLRMSCLRQRLQELSAAAGVLSLADRQVVSKAAQIAASLSPLSACDDVEALRTSMPALDPVTKAEVTDVRDRLARANMLYVSMNYKDGLPAAVDGLARARATLYQPVIAEALLQLGTIQVARTDRSAADTLEQAFLTAEASRYDSVAVRASTSLAKHVGGNLSRRDDGLRWLRIARAVLTRTGGDRDAAAVANAAAALLDVDGHYDEALVEYRRELAIRDKSADRDDQAIAAAHGRIGWILIAQRHPDAALREFRLAITGAETTLGPDSPVVETQHRNIGAALDALGRYDEALVEYRRALATDERILGPKHPSVATLHSNIGGVLFNQGHNDQALAEYRRALAIENEVLGPEHRALATTHDNIGKALVNAGKFAEGLDEHRRALAIEEAAGPPDHPDAGGIHINTGTALRMLHKYDEAIEQYRAGLAILIKTMGPEHPHVAIAYLDVGSVLAEQGKFDQALVEQRRALALQVVALGSEHPDVALTRNNIAVTLAMQGKLEDALVEWSSVLALRVKVLGPQHPATASTMADIGKADFGLGRFGSAVENLHGALAILGTKSPDFDDQVAEIRFDLAQALWSENKVRGEAIAVARRSRDDYAKLKRTQNVAEVDAWLATHDRAK